MIGLVPQLLDSSRLVALGLLPSVLPTLPRHTINREVVIIAKETTYFLAPFHEWSRMRISLPMDIVHHNE